MIPSLLPCRPPGDTLLRGVARLIRCLARSRRICAGFVQPTRAPNHVGPGLALFLRRKKKRKEKKKRGGGGGGKSEEPCSPPIKTKKKKNKRGQQSLLWRLGWCWWGRRKRWKGRKEGGKNLGMEQVWFEMKPPLESAEKYWETLQKWAVSWSN